MSELRQDILTGEWVIFAGNRMKRPYDFIKKSIPKTDDASGCQFCPGNENLTTNAVYQDGPDGKWTMRAFPNKYPALSDDSYDYDDEGFYFADSGYGIHEVIVDTPNHNEVIHDFSEDKLLEVLKVLKERFLVISDVDGIEYVQLFKNCGPDAGASILHSHWQIIGVPIVPREQETIQERCEDYKKEYGDCLICDMLEHEDYVDKRIIAENDQFIAFCPYASKMSYETMIAAKEHIRSFGDFDDDALESLAQIFKVILSGIKTLRKDICYNICFQDTPAGMDGHWYMKILPRMGNPAGFEYGTNSYINPILPEDAAKYMRKKIMENLRGK